MRIDHVMLPVADMARSLAFYRDIFGMRVLETRGDGHRQFAHIGYGPRGEQATLELICEQGSAVTIGGGHLCLQVTNLETWLAAPQLREHVFARPHGMRDGMIARVWIRDPDGHLVEVAQVP